MVFRRSRPPDRVFYKSKIHARSLNLFRILNLVTVFWESRLTVTRLDEMSHVRSLFPYLYNPLATSALHFAIWPLDYLLFLFLVEELHRRPKPPLPATSLPRRRRATDGGGRALLTTCGSSIPRSKSRRVGHGSGELGLDPTPAAAPDATPHCPAVRRRPGRLEASSSGPGPALPCPSPSHRPLPAMPDRTDVSCRCAIPVSLRPSRGRGAAPPPQTSCALPPEKMD